MIVRPGSAVVTLPTDREIQIERFFDAPPALVFEAWTTPEHVTRWWGVRQAPMVSCEIDLRVGGGWRYVSRLPDGTELGWHGTYREVERPDRLVSTEVFEGFPDAESLNTAVFAEHDGGTALSITVLHQSRENRDGHLASGMETGLQQSLDDIERLLGDRAV